VKRQIAHSVIIEDNFSLTEPICIFSLGSGSMACGIAGRATDQIRTGHQSQPAKALGLQRSCNKTLLFFPRTRMDSAGAGQFSRNSMQQR
jgi:hypothetical protein